MIKVNGFVCDHCSAAGKPRRIFSSASSCARHEKNCYYNPGRRACATCALCVQDLDNDDPKAVWGNGFGCEELHDREDAGMCNGAILPASPQHDCKHWKPKVPNVKLTSPPISAGETEKKA